MAKFMKMLNNISRSQAVYRRVKVSADDLMTGHYAFVLAVCRDPGRSQEELARALYVSRTAISKWESGRGYPNIDSLKSMGQFFGVSIDELLSSNEVLTIAEEDNKQKEKHFRDVVFGLLDIGVLLLLFLPFFGYRKAAAVHTVSLLSLTEIPLYLRIAYLAVAVSLPVMGILMLALQNFRGKRWLRLQYVVSLGLNAAGMLLFVVSLQPYPAVFLFLLLTVKTVMMMTRSVSPL